MKKCFFGIITVFLFLTACASKPAANGGITLDQALSEAATRIDGRISAGTKIAPLNFNSPHDKFSGYVLDEVTANLVDSGKLTVVDRKEVDLIRGEFDFQFSGEVADDSMQKLGSMLGAQSIISGSLTDMGGFYRIVIRVLNVQNASVEVQYRANIVSDTITTALLTGGKTQVAAAAPRQTPSGGTATPVVQVPAQAQVLAPPVPAVPPAPTTYNVGDTGPAGGIIFYDKGNSSGGWQYLEAAPASTETTLLWGPSGEVGGTAVGIGTGKENTQIILSWMRRNGGSNSAAQYCASLNYGRYNDWFLPSKDELNLMYTNLRRRGLGGFEYTHYWSSSEANSESAWHAWFQRFSDGDQTSGGYGVDKDKSRFLVRAMRSF